MPDPLKKLAEETAGKLSTIPGMSHLETVEVAEHAKPVLLAAFAEVGEQIARWLEDPERDGFMDPEDAEVAQILRDEFTPSHVPPPAASPKEEA